MYALVIHAPDRETRVNKKKGFDEVLKSGLGEEYAIYERLYCQITPGCDVLVLDKDRKRRAEGKLDKLVFKGQARNGVKRYDVHMKGLKEVAYKEEKLERIGAAVI